MILLFVTFGCPSSPADSEPPAEDSGSESSPSGEDCDDADLVKLWTDADADGFGDPLTGRFGCAGAGTAERDGDCDDSDSARFPGALELCNGYDDDCDETTAEIAQIGEVPYPSLADALGVAADGATVTVCAGVHLVRDLRIERSVAIVGAAGDPAQTVLDAEQTGPLFAVVGGASLTVEGLTLTHGTGRPTPSLDWEPLAGGAINAMTGGGGAVVVRGCVLEGNTAEFGGAIAGSDLTVEDSVLRDNRSLQDGGAIYHDGPSALTVTDSTFEGNVAELGGAILVGDDATISGSTFTANEAVAFGGALALMGRRNDPLSVVFATTTLEDNVAAEWGGGIYALDAHVTMDDATILLGNQAPSGGGAYVIGDHDGLTWTGGRFEGNTAGLGGGLYFGPYGNGGTLSFVTAIGNSADDGGGVFWSAAPGGLFTDATVEGNVAVRGGGIGAMYDPLVMQRISVVGNQAERGAGLHVEYEARVLDSAITANVASVAGGAFYLLDADATVTDTDLGVDATDNLPDDVLFDNNNGDELTYTFGAAASFECRSRSEPGAYGCFSP